MDFLLLLFDTADVPPRWHCGHWTAAHGWLHILSDLAIWAAYFTIPISLGWLLARRRDVPFRSVFVLFAAFIVLCGSAHLIEAAIFWWPAYRLAGVVKLATAVVSWVTAITLIRAAPSMLTMRSAAELDALVATRTAEKDEALTSLRIEREFLATTLASLNEAVLATDPEGRITILNKAGERLTGWSSDEAVGEPLGRVLRMRDATTQAAISLDDQLEFATPGTGRVAQEAILVTKAGAERFVSYGEASIAADDSEAWGVVLVVRDVTARHSAEIQRRQSEERYVALVEATAQIVWATDAAGKVVGDSPSWRAFTGQTYDQWQEYGWLDAIHPADRDATRTAWQAAVASRGNYLVDYRLRRHDGIYRWTTARAVPILDPDGSVREWVGMNVDITEQRRAQRDLEESELRFRLVSDAANEAIRDWDLVRDEMTWNDGLGRCFGHSLPDERVTGSWWRERIHADDRDAVGKSIELALGGGDRTWTGTYRFRCASGSYANVFDRVRIVREGPQPVRVVGSMLDMTKQKALEEELRVVAAELSEANRRKDEFLATLAHELRNPLAPIRTSLELIKLSEGRPDVLARSSEVMERQLVHMVRLVDDLMDVSRISRGKIELKKEALPLRAVLDRAIEASRPIMDAREHRFELVEPVPEGVVFGDPVRLAQVFANLLHNAAKYTRPGGNIDVEIVRGEASMEVRVRDDGVGIPADRLDSIFEMFHQLDSALERSDGGLGIGLTLVRRLLEMHEGSIEVHSEGVGHGATFVVRLPLHDASADPDKVLAEEVDATHPSLKVLVVDDNRDGADALTMMMQLRGYQAFTAYDGLAAFEMAEQVRPDVVLLDIGMPKLNGYEVAQRIRAQAWGTGVVLVAVTGWGQEPDRRRTQDAGFDHHLVKPVDPAVLMSYLANLR
jgi:PAS domain S-box-containing protein